MPRNIEVTQTCFEEHNKFLFEINKLFNAEHPNTFNTDSTL